MDSPKYVEGQLDFSSITDEELAKDCCKEELEAVKQFYRILDGTTLLLSLWDYDNEEDYHLSGWNDETDEKMMKGMFELEKVYGAYDDFEKFKKDWKAKKYDCGCSIVFPKKCVEVIKEVF